MSHSQTPPRKDAGQTPSGKHAGQTSSSKHAGQTSSSKHAGQTLVQLVVSVAITAVLVIGVTDMLTTAQKSNQSAMAQTEFDHLISQLNLVMTGKNYQPGQTSYNKNFCTAILTDGAGTTLTGAVNPTPAAMATINQAVDIYTQPKSQGGVVIASESSPNNAKYAGFKLTLVRIQAVSSPAANIYYAKLHIEAQKRYTNVGSNNTAAFLGSDKMQRDIPLWVKVNTSGVVQECGLLQVTDTPTPTPASATATPTGASPTPCPTGFTSNDFGPNITNIGPATGTYVGGGTYYQWVPGPVKLKGYAWGAGGGGTCGGGACQPSASGGFSGGGGGAAQIQIPLGPGCHLIRAVVGQGGAGGNYHGTASLDGGYSSLAVDGTAYAYAYGGGAAGYNAVGTGGSSWTLGSTTGAGQRFSGTSGSSNASATAGGNGGAAAWGGGAGGIGGDSANGNNTVGVGAAGAYPGGGGGGGAAAGTVGGTYAGGYNGGSGADGRVYITSSEAWTSMTTTGAPVARALYQSVWTGKTWIIWGGYDGTNPLGSGAIYDPYANSWTAITTTGAPSARYGHSMVYAHNLNRVVVWGGQTPTVVGTGAVYNIASDAWTTMTTTGAPAARQFAGSTYMTNVVNPAKMLWMLIWGGCSDTACSAFLQSGAGYDITNNNWTSMTSTGAPAAETWTGDNYPTMVWTGTQALYWNGQPASGGIYNTITDTWSAMATASAPSARVLYSSSYSGDETSGQLMIWGGENTTGPADLNTGAIYNVSGNTWTTMTTTGAPAARTQPLGVWTGDRYLVWGGYTVGSNTAQNNGGIYVPVTNQWLAMTSTGAPSSPTGHQYSRAVWTGSRMLIWGGSSNALGGGSFSSSGSIYSPP